MNDVRNKTLAQIVTEDHRAGALFERYHLDFCCKGKRTLEQACAENKLDTEFIIAELTNKTSTTPQPGEQSFEKMSLTGLIDYIVLTHHTYVKNEMPSLYMYLQKVASKHGGRHPEMLSVFDLFAQVKNEMELHMIKEEKILFPRIKQLEELQAAGDELNFNILHLQSPISMMEQEHEQAGSALAEIRKLTNNYTLPADACTTYKLSYAALEAFELDLHQHVHLENNILFPKSISLFAQHSIPSAN